MRYGFWVLGIGVLDALCCYFIVLIYILYIMVENRSEQLTPPEYQRYGRQLIMKEIGLKG